MVRHRHYYRPLKGDYIPSRVVVIDVDTKTEQVDGNPRWERDTLALWRAVAWTAEGSRVIREYSAEGNTPAEFWDRLGKFAHNGGMTWVFSFRANRSLSCLNVWELLERRWLTLERQSRAKPEDGSAEPGLDYQGVVSLSDHPFVLDIYLN